MSRNQWTRRDMLKASTALALPASGAGPCTGSGRIGAAERNGASRRHRLWRTLASDPGRGRRQGIPRGGGLRLRNRQSCKDTFRNCPAARKWGVYEDFRKMIDDEKLDAVMVETTTHARGWITIQAMQAGMDVYIEKPMCLTIGEGRTMVKAARKLNRVTQVGTQQRSMPINNWASDLVKNGAIGKITTVLAPNFVSPFRWTKTSSADVKELRSKNGGTSGRTKPSCGPTARKSTTAGRAGGTMTAAACASE